MARPFDGFDELPLVFRAGTGNAFRDDLPLLADETLESLLVFVIDVNVFVLAEFARAFLSDD